MGWHEDWTYTDDAKPDGICTLTYLHLPPSPSPLPTYLHAFLLPSTFCVPHSHTAWRLGCCRPVGLIDFLNLHAAPHWLLTVNCRHLALFYLLSGRCFLRFVWRILNTHLHATYILPVSLAWWHGHWHGTTLLQAWRGGRPLLAAFLRVGLAETNENRQVMAWHF